MLSAQSDIATSYTGGPRFICVQYTMSFLKDNKFEYYYSVVAVQVAVPVPVPVAEWRAAAGSGTRTRTNLVRVRAGLYPGL